MKKRPTLSQLLQYEKENGLTALCQYLSENNLMQELLTEKQVKDMIRKYLDIGTENDFGDICSTIDLLLKGGSETGWYWNDTSLQGASCFGETYPINELQDLYLENDFYNEY